VPAPGAVTIDGSVAEWDLSGQIWLYPDRGTRDEVSVRIAAMHDQEAFYIGAVWRDSSPMASRLTKSSKTDMLAIYMQTDVAWGMGAFYYTPAQEAR